MSCLVDGLVDPCTNIRVRHTYTPIKVEVNFELGNNLEFRNSSQHMKSQFKFGGNMKKVKKIKTCKEEKNTLYNFLLKNRFLNCLSGSHNNKFINKIYSNHFGPYRVI